MSWAFGRRKTAAAESRTRGGRSRTRGGRHVQGRYEGAETTDENEPLWRMTDYLSARAANSFQVRRTLKIRARNEGANNSYFRGIVDSISNDLIGSGPRLQVRTKDAGLNKRIEAAFHNWGRAIQLAGKLRLMAKSKITDGEAFGLLVTNRNLKRTFGEAPDNPSNPDRNLRELNVDDAVQLDVVVIESDQVTTPDPGFTDFFWVDGIVLDRLGNPAEYHVLRHHPGDLFIPQLNPLKYDRWKPEHVLQWFRKDRPGQVRGVPEITPALDLFAQLRRYTKAVITAAETAADMSMFIETQMPANQDPQRPVEFDRVHNRRGMITFLPWGTKATSFASSQPGTTYEMFVRVLLREICRCLGIPLNIAMGDSSGYNYSSGRLDHLGYHRQQRVDRQACGEDVLDKIFAAWLEEAIEIPGLIDGLAELGILSIQDLPHRWFFDSAESINPIEDRQAEQLELQNGTKTLSAIYAEKGEDWRVAMRQTAEEAFFAFQLAKEYSIPVEALLHKSPEVPAPAPEGTQPAGPTQTRAGAWRQHWIRGVTDDNGQEHAADGKFGKGGGGGSTDAETKHKEWKAEDEKRESKRDKFREHSDELDEEAHQKADEEIERKHKSEDKAIAKTRERERSGLEKKQNRERSALERKQERERSKAEDAVGEAANTDEYLEKEEKLQKRYYERKTEIEKEYEKKKQEIDNDKSLTTGQSYDAYKAAKAEKEAALKKADEEWKKGGEELLNSLPEEKALQELEQKQRQEEDALADKHSDETQAQDERWEKEDAERGKVRESEKDNARYERQKQFDERNDEQENLWEEQDEEREKARKKEHPEAHKSYYGDDKTEASGHRGPRWVRGRGRHNATSKEVDAHAHTSA